MGNPAFSLPGIEAMHSCWGDPVGVYTAPDRRRGRGLSRGFSPLKAYSLERGWPIFQPPSLKRDVAIQQFIDLSPDLVVVAAYGLLIPPEMLGVPKHGFINIHPSLLPRYRGPSPVPSAILDGVEETGVSLMLLDQGLDTGPVLAQQATKILPGEKADALTLRLFQCGRPTPGRKRPPVDRRAHHPQAAGSHPGHLYLQAHAGRRAGGLAGECSNAVP